jgi:hypothetical protein
MFPADASMTFIPVLTEPVNITLPTRGSRTRASPTSPAPGTTVSTPARLWPSSTRTSTGSGVLAAARTHAAQPAASYLAPSPFMVLPCSRLTT